MIVELRLGPRIKALRLAAELTQEELATRANLTKGFISQFENDQYSISVDSLADIVEALGVTLGEFFSDEADARAIFGQDDRLQVDSKGVSRFELLIPGSTNNMMDPILVELEPGESLDELPPGPGEQFGYVLKGTVTLRLNQKKERVRTKQCFYFESDRTSRISNESNSVARLLWVTTPPLM